MVRETGPICILLQILVGNASSLVQSVEHCKCVKSFYFLAFCECYRNPGAMGYTGQRKMVRRWFGELGYCSCLPVFGDNSCQRETNLFHRKMNKKLFQSLLPHAVSHSRKKAPFLFLPSSILASSPHCCVIHRRHCRNDRRNPGRIFHRSGRELEFCAGKLMMVTLTQGAQRGHSAYGDIQGTL